MKNVNLNTGERIQRLMGIGEFRKVTSLCAALSVPRVEVEESVHDVGGLDLIVAHGNAGGYTNIPRDEWMIERYE